jgi:hypothetical protein
MSKSLLKENINKISKETILDFYIEQNHTKKEVCNKFGITMSGLSLLLKHYEIVKDKSAVVMLRKRTNLKKYGVDNPAKSAKIKEKISKANKSLNKEEVEKHNKEIKALYDIQCEDSAQTQSQLLRETYQYYRDEWQEKLPKFNYALFVELWNRACYEDDLYADRFNWIDYELKDLHEYFKLMNYDEI